MKSLKIWLESILREWSKYGSMKILHWTILLLNDRPFRSHQLLASKMLQEANKKSWSTTWFNLYKTELKLDFLLLSNFAWNKLYLLLMLIVKSNNTSGRMKCGYLIVYLLQVSYKKKEGVNREYQNSNHSWKIIEAVTWIPMWTPMWVSLMLHTFQMSSIVNPEWLMFKVPRQAEKDLISERFRSHIIPQAM